MTTTNARWASITSQRPEESAEAVERVPSTPSESAADPRLAAEVDRALRTTGYLELRGLRIYTEIVENRIVVV